jgi:hypothetical protein
MRTLIIALALGLVGCGEREGECDQEDDSEDVSVICEDYCIDEIDCYGGQVEVEACWEICEDGLTSTSGWLWVCAIDCSADHDNCADWLNCIEACP